MNIDEPLLSSNTVRTFLTDTVQVEWYFSPPAGELNVDILFRSPMVRPLFL